MKAKRISKGICLIAALSLCLCGCSSDDNGSSASGGSSVSDETAGEISAETSQGADETAEMFTDRDMRNEYNESECIVIEFDASSISCESEQAEITDSVITIKEGGNYILRGNLDDGMVIVEAGDDEKVQLILDNVSINCDTSAAIYVRQADKVFITTAEGSKNILTGGKSYEAIDDNNIDATIFSKSDLTLNGLGELAVTSESGHGIVSKDDLKITSGAITVTSADHGISGKDSVRIAGGSIDITCVEDGIHSENNDDPEKGFVYIQDGEITIEAGDDGIHAGLTLTIVEGSIDITNSYEGLEGLGIEILGGDISLVSKDDGLNAASSSDTGSNNQEGGSELNQDMVPGMNHDNIHQKPGMNQQEMPEDFNPEEMQDNLHPADMPQDFAANDMHNNHGNGMGGGGKGGMDVQEDAYILISGGSLYINAEGDGIDSNGIFTMTGGTVYVDGPQNGGNGALDYGISASITGGTIVAVGASGMAENFTQAENQAAVMITFSGVEKGTEIAIYDNDGNKLVSFTAAKQFDSAIISCPELQTGNSYIIRVDDRETEINIESSVSRFSGI